MAEGNDRPKDQSKDQPKDQPRDQAKDRPQDKPKKSSGKKIPWVWLSIAFASYAFTGWLVLNLLPPLRFADIVELVGRRDNIKIADPALQFFAIAIMMVVVLPIVTSLSEFSRLAITYFIGGAVVISLPILKDYIEHKTTSLNDTISKSIVWLGIVSLPIVGEKLRQAPFERLAAIAILSMTGTMGIGLGWLVHQIGRSTHN